MAIPSRINNASKQGYTAVHTHIVQFSEHDDSLITTVTRLIVDGLQAGSSCLVFATPAHRANLEQHLTIYGADLAAARANGTFVSLDARETLTHFLVDNQPEPARFFEVIEPLIERAAQGQRSVTIFGEMVALLWAEGNRTAAIRLEELWNDLGQKHAFSLLCTYPMQSFNGHNHEAEFIQICQQHSQIMPSENYVRLSEQERIRAFTLLQQKAHTLEVEVAQRQADQKRLRMLAAIIESTDDAVLSKDLDGTITSWNTAAERIYGYTAQEMIGQSVTQIFPPNRQDEFEQIMARIRRGERVDHHETRRMRKDGTFLTVSVTISPIKDEVGTIIGASAIARDVTDQRRLEAKSQQLFASNLVGIFVANTEGKLLEANRAFLNLLGYSQAEWQVDTMQSDTSPACLSPSLRSLVLQASQSCGNIEPQETVIQQKSGKDLPVMVAVAIMEHTDTCIGFVLDISERKALEKRKDDFIGMASHELKTPVTSLKGFLVLLQRQLVAQGNERTLHYLARMDSQIEKLTKLINDLLDISRMQTGRLVYREERVEVDDLVQEVVESVQETTQTHQLQVKGQTQTTVVGDRDRLGQVLINLLNNAIKYSPQADTVIVHLSQEEQHVLISVQDFGLGIAREHHTRIFERFYQVADPVEKTYPGLGIGLTISHDIAIRHGGQLWVDSQKGQGAIFHLRLPRAIQEQADARKNERKPAKS